MNMLTNSLAAFVLIVGVTNIVQAKPVAGNHYQAPANPTVPSPRLVTAPAAPLEGCNNNLDGCSKTLANLSCGGKSWDPDGDGNYTCKPKQNQSRAPQYLKWRP